MTEEDIEFMLEYGMTVSAMDVAPLIHFTPPEKPKGPKSDYDRYLEYIDMITPDYSEFGDGWGGSLEPRQMAMKQHPFEEWNGGLF